MENLIIGAAELLEEYCESVEDCKLCRLKELCEDSDKEISLAQELREAVGENEFEQCPFCGNKNITFTTCKSLEECENFEECEFEGYYAAICSVNVGGCGATSGYQENKSKAIESWNRRAK